MVLMWVLVIIVTICLCLTPILLYFSQVHYTYNVENHQIDVFVRPRNSLLFVDGKVLENKNIFFTTRVVLEGNLEDIRVKVLIKSGFIIPKVKTFVNDELMQNGKNLRF